MGFGASGSKKTQSSAENTQQAFNQSNNQATSGSTTATFDSPEAQQLLAHLTGLSSGGVGGAGQEAQGIYSRMGQIPGTGSNPYLESIIKRSNAEGDAALGGDLAQVRAGGYRGGTAANLAGQTDVIARAANNRALGNATLRASDYNTNLDRNNQTQLASAGGLMGIEQANQQKASLAAQILALLRGESTSGTQTGTTAGTATGAKQGTGQQNEFDAGFSILKGK